MRIIEELYRQNPWWEGSFPFKFITREKYLSLLKKNLNNRDIIFLIGLRRVGKTTIFKMMINYLLEHFDPKYILYVSLDSYNLEDYSIHKIVEEYRKEHRLRREEKVFLFFDEVAHKEHFAQELKNLYDLENVKIYASSSSSSAIKGRKPYLVGRERIIEVLPLDFDEYLLFKKIKIKRSDFHLLKRYFEDYMMDGGMPEYVLTGDVSYLNSLIEDIIMKDVALLHNLKDISVVKDYFKILMERVGKRLSINKITKIIGISPDTSRRYLSYFIDTFLIYSMERCGKLNERVKSPKKIYVVDVGIRNFITGFKDKGSVFENLVFLKIKDKNPCYVYENGIEIDFKIDKTLIEVKYEREIQERQKNLLKKFPDSEYKKLVVKDVFDFLSLSI